MDTVCYRRETFICIASGPSLNQELIDMVAEAKRDSNGSIGVIAVNDNWKWKDLTDDSFIADHIYAGDPEFWQMYLRQMEREGANDIPKWIPINEAFAKKNVQYNIRALKCAHEKGLGKDTILHCGSHSGYQAINLAFMFGAKKIIMLGYDMKTGPQGKVHWFGNHPNGLRNTPNKYSGWIARYTQLASDLKDEGVDVVNCSPVTGIECIRKGSLADELIPNNISCSLK